MSDAITQMRLAIRLDNYFREYMDRYARNATHSKEKWEKAWQSADIARIHNALTPELVDDVLIELHSLETAI